MQETKLLGVMLLLSSTVFADQEFLNSRKENQNPSTNQIEVQVHADSCTFPCIVVYQGSVPRYRHVNFLSVTWQGKIGSSNYYQDITDWHKLTKLDFAVPNTQCKKLTRSTSEELWADCSLTLDACDSKTEDKFEGVYRCIVKHRITQYNSSITSRLTVVSKPSPEVPEGPEGEASLNCHPPEARNIIGREFYDSDGFLKLNISWTPTVKPRDKPYCNGSRRWKVRVLSFESVEDLNDEQNVDDDQLIFIPTNKPRETHFLWSQNLTRDMYYLFQVQNEKPVTGRVSATTLATFTSYIHYFGAQISPSFDSTVEVLSARVGGMLTIECEAKGAPTPDYRLVYQGDTKRLLNNQFTIRGFSEGDAGDYFCSASIFHVNPPEGKRRFTANKKIVVQVKEPQFLPNDPSLRVCVTYNGGLCRNYIYSDTRVFINSTAQELESTIQDYALDINHFGFEHQRNLDTPTYQSAGITQERLDKCKDFLEAIACNLVYPYCDVVSRGPRPICHHSCEVLRGECSFFFEFLPEDSIQLGQIRDTLMANCDDRVNPAGTSPECIYVSYESPAIDAVGDQIKESLCVKGKGRGYSGSDYQHTESGIPCQTWASQSPNKHSITPSHFSLELYGAGFACRNPGGLGERPWCYTANTESGKRWEYCSVPQCESCERYTHKFCSSLTGYSERSVYVDREDWIVLTMDDIESGMVGLYHSLDGDQLTPGCQNALRHMICHGTLPFCKDNNSPTPLKSCRDHCILFDEMRYHCPDEVLTTLQTRWTSSSVRRLFPPDCDLEQPEECMPAPSRLTAQAPTGSAYCYNVSDYGLGYSGSVSETLTGSQCVEWADTNTTFTVENYPELTDGGNHCRNPGQWEKVPWCFTANGGVELCGVEQCETGVVGPQSPQEERFAQLAGAVAFAIIAVIVIVVVVVIISGIIYRVYHKRHASTLGNSPPHLQMIRSDNVKNVKFHANNHYNMLVLDQCLPPKVAEAIISFHQIPQDSIEYVKQLGQGFFGMVFKGRMKPVVEGEEEVLVAVKTLKEDTNDDIEAFVNEAKLMFGFDHQNIVKILGVSMTKTPYYLIFEYMDKGDLAKFLRDNASSVQRRYMNPSDRPRSRTESTLSDDPASLNSEQLMDICKQIASGMEYLSSMKYVHRDLACRNCLVKSVTEDDSSTPSHVIVKIGDFGLSHNLYSKDYYRVRGQAVLPIRWMSPEAIIYGKFSTAGDVWSFGVVMWEIFTFGMQPYYGTSNEEVMERVRHGKVLPKPTDCSARMYTIMTECWQKCDQDRPNFTDILMYLDECRASVSSNDAQSVYSDYSSDAFLEENSDIELDQPIQQ